MSIEILPVAGLPEIAHGDDLAAMIAARVGLRDDDVVVVAQKVISKAEGRVVEVDPSRRAEERARLVEAETADVLARRGDLVIVRTRHGYVCAHAGVDASNLPPDRLALLPEDPDASAVSLRARLHELTGAAVGVIISDTFGRPWRLGQVNVALGVAGVAALLDYRGRKDSFGSPLEATVIAVADEIASAAELVMGKSDGVPVVVVRGLEELPREGSGAEIVRPLDEDLFPRGLDDSR